MKTTKNYVTINEQNVVQLHGFEHIKDFFYVEIFEKKTSLVFATAERDEKDACFKVCVEQDRTVKHPRLCNLITEYGLESKRFWEDNHFKNYLSTDIGI